MYEIHAKRLRSGLEHYLADCVRDGAISRNDMRIRLKKCEEKGEFEWKVVKRCRSITAANKTWNLFWNRGFNVYVRKAEGE